MRGYMKKLFLTIGLTGLLAGSAQPIQATTQPETWAAAGVSVLLLGLAGLSELAGEYGYTNVLGTIGAALIGGAAGYLVNNICTSAALQSLWPWAFANATVMTLGGGITVGTILAVLLTDTRVKGSPSFKRWAKVLFGSGVALSVAAGASYIANANGRHISIDLKPIEEAPTNL